MRPGLDRAVKSEGVPQLGEDDRMLGHALIAFEAIDVVEDYSPALPEVCVLIGGVGGLSVAS